MFKVIKRYTIKRCEICSKLTIKTPERRRWRRSDVFNVNFEHVSRFFLVFILFTLNKQILAGYFRNSFSFFSHILAKMFLMALACCWVASHYFTIISNYLTESAMLLKENDVPIVKWACFLIGKFLQFLEAPHQMLFF